jgi:hypothetical protein
MKKGTPPGLIILGTSGCGNNAFANCAPIAHVLFTSDNP